MVLWFNGGKKLKTVQSNHMNKQLFRPSVFFFNGMFQMDVRGSLNAEDNQEYITGEGSHSMVENDSFYAKAPPLAASTVGRSKSRSVNILWL